MITSIEINNEKFPGFEIVGEQNGNVNNLTKINILIGSNNSGKSRFLRHLINQDLSIQIKQFNSKEISSIINQLKKEVIEYLTPYTRNAEVQSVLNKVQDIHDNEYLDSAAPKINMMLQQINTLSSISTNMINDGTGFNPSIIFKDTREKISRYKDHIYAYAKDFNEDHVRLKKFYIPILRGLRPLQAVQGSAAISFDTSVNNYLQRSIYDYKIEINKKIHVHTGLDMYKEVTELLLGEHEDRLKIKEFEDFMSKTFFNEQPVHIVPRIGKDVLFIKIGDEKQYPIYELGEGIQAIILLTYPLFFNTGVNAVFFIEEPELHLHPGLERIFIETLRNERFNSFQYFVTTHSNHILDLTLEYNDISVYSFQKEVINDNSSFLINNVNSNHKHILDLLGVRNSSLFLSNCTIWVEGITDRLYIRKYLELFNSECNFREDFHYSFIEYAGSNLTHWSFLESDDLEFSNINIEGICSKIFLIVDNDGVELPSKRDKSKKKERHHKLKLKLGDNLYVTKGLEIENLLSKKTIKEAIKSIEGANAAQLDFTEFDIKSHTNIYLGDFIETTVKGFKKKYKSEYGTIYNKVNFCKQAIRHTNSIADMSNEAKELTSTILKFIKQAN